jgi:hypothetical protein
VVTSARSQPSPSVRTAHHLGQTRKLCPFERAHQPRPDRAAAAFVGLTAAPTRGISRQPTAVEQRTETVKQRFGQRVDSGEPSRAIDSLTSSSFQEGCRNCTTGALMRQRPGQLPTFLFRRQIWPSADVFVVWLAEPARASRLASPQGVFLPVIAQGSSCASSVRVSLSSAFGAIGPHRPDDADLGTSVEHETQPIANLPKWCPGPGRRDNFSNRRLSSASLPRCACCGAGCWRCRGGQPLVCGFSKSSRRWDGAGQETPACVTETVQADCAPDGARRRSAR